MPTPSYAAPASASVGRQRGPGRRDPVGVAGRVLRQRRRPTASRWRATAPAAARPRIFPRSACARSTSASSSTCSTALVAVPAERRAEQHGAVGLAGPFRREDRHRLDRVAGHGRDQAPDRPSSGVPSRAPAGSSSVTSADARVVERADARPTRRRRTAPSSRAAGCDGTASTTASTSRASGVAGSSRARPATVRRSARSPGPSGRAGPRRRHRESIAATSRLRPPSTVANAGSGRDAHAATASPVPPPAACARRGRRWPGRAWSRPATGRRPGRRRRRRAAGRPDGPRPRRRTVAGPALRPRHPRRRPGAADRRRGRRPRRVRHRDPGHDARSAGYAHQRAARHRHAVHRRRTWPRTRSAGGSSASPSPTRCASVTAALAAPVGSSASRVRNVSAPVSTRRPVDRAGAQLAAEPVAALEHGQRDVVAERVMQRQARPRDRRCRRRRSRRGAPCRCAPSVWRDSRRPWLSGPKVCGPDRPRGSTRPGRSPATRRDRG